MDDRSVLVVEDNPVLAEAITFALTTFGWRVVGPFASLEDALDAARKGSFAIAVLDLELGSDSSVPIAEVLRQNGIPFLFLTGHEVAREIPAEFAHETCLTKPVTPEKLVKELESCLEGQRRAPNGS